MLHLLLAQGTKGGGSAGDVLSLEEILAEGAATCDRRNAPGRLQVGVVLFFCYLFLYDVMV